MDSCLWRTSGFVYFLLTFIQVVTSLDFWSTCCVYLGIECCRKPQIEYNSLSFTDDVAKLHGQPFASSIVPSYLRSQHYLTKKQPICFYFHGDTGTGKTLLTSLIIKNIYQYGMSSKFVKFFHLGKDYFKDDERRNKNNLLKLMIHSKVLSCPKSLFVFDGYSDYWFEIIHFIFLFNKDFMEAIFIFISNSDVQPIHTYMQKKQNHMNAMQYEDLKESAIKRNPYLREANIVYVPFLPMHIRDVHKCISDHLDKLKISLSASTKEKLITGITELIEFTNDISISGCKKVVDKTSLFLAQYYSHQEL